MEPSKTNMTEEEIKNYMEKMSDAERKQNDDQKNKAIESAEVVVQSWLNVANLSGVGPVELLVASMIIQNIFEEGFRSYNRERELVDEDFSDEMIEQLKEKIKIMGRE